MPEVRKEIVINAPIETVWKALTHFSEYKQWNNNIRDITLEGDFQIGNTATLFVALKEGGLPRPFPVTLATIDENKTLCWEGGIGPSWLARGFHYHYLEPLPDNCTRFIQGERFTGLLFIMAWPFQKKSFNSSYDNVNHALKNYCEGSSL